MHVPEGHDEPAWWQARLASGHAYSFQGTTSPQ
jgi:hypothetical protein